MDIAEFIKIFEESFDDLQTKVFPETYFKQLEEWNSMQALLLIAQIDDTLCVVLNAEDIKNSSTVSDLYTLVVNQL